MWLGVYLFGVYWGGSFFTEQDASWHQVIIRDTSFTPSHVVVFYGSFPMYIVCGVASYLYAMTRLPLYRPGHLVPAGHGHCRPAHDSSERRPERMGSCLLVHGRTVQRTAALGLRDPGLVWPVLWRHCCTDHHPLLQPDRRRLERTRAKSSSTTASYRKGLIEESEQWPELLKSPRSRITGDGATCNKS